MKKYGQQMCGCGATKTAAPLKECRPCRVCGKILHSQYQIIYHPDCKPMTQRYRHDAGPLSRHDLAQLRPLDWRR